jgi:uncharacterized protein (DUF4415 family)
VVASSVPEKQQLMKDEHMKKICDTRSTMKLTPKLRVELAALQAKPDTAIDTADMPEIMDWSRAERGKFYRPVKKQVTLRLDADILHWFKSHAGNARGYQTQINDTLRKFVEKEARKSA